MPSTDRDRQRRRKERSTASWILVAVLGTFFLAVFVYALTHEVPPFAQKMLGLIAALLAGAAAFFLTGNLGLDVHWLSDRFGQIGVKGAGGLAVFALVLLWWQAAGPITAKVSPPTKDSPSSADAGAGSEAERLNDLGQEQFTAGKYLDARTSFEKARNLARTEGQEAEPIAVSASMNLAHTLAALGSLVEARRLGETTAKEAEEILGPHHRARLGAMSILANIYEWQGDFAGAHELWQQLLALCRKDQGEKDPETLAVWNNLALNLYRQGKLDQAAEQQETLLRMAEAVPGREDTGTLQYESNLAWTLLGLGNLREARRHLEHAVPGLERGLGADHPATLGAQTFLADLLRTEGHPAEAARLRQEILKKRRRSLGDEAPDSLRSEADLARDDYALGDLDGARELQDHVLEVRRRILGESHPYTLRAKADLAVTLRAQGHLPEARKRLEEAVGGLRRQLGAHHPDTSAAEWELATTLQNMGDTAGARPLLESLRWLREAAPSGLSAEQKKIAGVLPALLRQ